MENQRVFWVMRVVLQFGRQSGAPLMEHKVAMLFLIGTHVNWTTHNWSQASVAQKLNPLHWIMIGY
ncbi:hypothetical protein HanIR_Chr16g0788001 [Helianthus annuus]|nr:hypothetical protein HanIR_Chr16g0788001 [Helianthus annuus]